MDLRTGHVVGKKVKVNPKGMQYLKTIPWLEEARRALAQERQQESQSEQQKRSGSGRLAPKRRSRRLFGR